MKIRAAAFCLVATVVALGPVRAHAQGNKPADPGPAASLAAKLAQLEARITALETIDESDVVGNWKWQSLGIEINRGYPGGPGTPARIGTEADNDVVFTLNADHSVQISGSTLRCTLPILTFAIPNCGPLDEEPVTLTWSFANGVVTISGDPEDGPMAFRMPANGVIVFGGSSEFEPGHTWANIGLLVKMPN